MMKSYFLVQLFGERVSMIYFPIFQEYMYKVLSDSLVLIHHVQVKIQDNGDLRLTALEATRVTTPRWLQPNPKFGRSRSFHPGVGVKILHPRISVY